MADKITDDKGGDKSFERSEKGDKLIEENGPCKRRNKNGKKRDVLRSKSSVGDQRIDRIRYAKMKR